MSNFLNDVKIDEACGILEKLDAKCALMQLYGMLRV